MKKNSQNKKKKRKINTDLAILLSHDITPLSRFFVLRILLQFIIRVPNISYLLQTLFRPISINSSTISIVLIVSKSP